ncbi:MAG TPA: hypothetical protein VM658_09845 [bacterium]|nr:hypothetical protein [bacterium]
MTDDGRRDPARQRPGENARRFRLTDVFGAFRRPGAEALSILAAGKTGSGPQDNQAGAPIMPPAPAEPEEKTG